MGQLVDLLDQYTFRVSWSAEDGVYLANTAELPTVFAHGDTKEDALAELRVALENVLEDMKENNEQIPQPFGDHNFSGKFQVRMAPALHRKLAVEAAEQGVSLNQWINLKLAQELR